MTIVYRSIVLISFVVGCSVLVEGIDVGMVANGKWAFIHAEKCENDHRYPIKMELGKKKVNRTHEEFNLILETDQEINDKFAIRVEICKHMDGGCKPYQNMGDASLPHFVEQFIESLFRRALSIAEPVIEWGYFPIPAGRYTVTGFEVDYCNDFPTKCLLGEFETRVYMNLDSVDRSCMKVKCEFTKEDESTCDGN